LLLDAGSSRVLPSLYLFPSFLPCPHFFSGLAYPPFSNRRRPALSNFFFRRRSPRTPQLRFWSPRSLKDEEAFRVSLLFVYTRAVRTSPFSLVFFFFAYGHFISFSLPLVRQVSQTTSCPSSINVFLDQPAPFVFPSSPPHFFHNLGLSPLCGVRPSPPQPSP